MDITKALIEIAYMVSAVTFIYGLKMLAKPTTAVRGNMVSACGMLLAIAVTLLNKDIISFEWVIIGGAIGTAIGALAALRVPMTSMPGFVAFFNGTGGLCSMLVGWSDYHVRFMGKGYGAMTLDEFVLLLATCLAMLIGGVTFAGSMVAYAKLEERMNSKPILFKSQQIVNALVLLGLFSMGAAYMVYPNEPWVYPLIICIMVLANVLGILATIPIGGADMPVVICLLNSYSGMAGCASGFVLNNTVLIVAGSLVGASGIILTNIMCKAMNRSIWNVLFSGFGSAEGSVGSAVQGEVKALTPEDAYFVLESANNVIFVPGYGMAVAQAQHVVRELGDMLQKNGAEVRYAVHPVAGRMPGHMNVLLAEANVPYDQLVEMDDVNPNIEMVDVAIVIGANDVVNPAAREDEKSPIYGMPIINVDFAKSCFVIKRSMRSGFAGVENPLFYKENTRMVFGDAKQVVSALIEQFKSA
ncbi:MAG: NAD(P)(+) transhydrogenase (Re/Si-specific) subunit beta [Candidatus Hydrogenedentes bacterium]|nr:NAD(P)(+) transhydrogenase (Re/Si-specific) subunit beta [Candidatus Hydrogenedentota bacterium]